MVSKPFESKLPWKVNVNAPMIISPTWFGTLVVPSFVQIPIKCIFKVILLYFQVSQSGVPIIADHKGTVPLSTFNKRNPTPEIMNIKKMGAMET